MKSSFEKILTVQRRRHTLYTLEHGDEISCVLEACLNGDLGNAFARSAQQLFRQFNFASVNVIYEIFTDFLTETAGKIAWAEMA